MGVIPRSITLITLVIVPLRFRGAVPIVSHLMIWTLLDYFHGLRSR